MKQRPRPLTDRFCIHAKAAVDAVQTDYFDADTTGLALRVFRSGAKSWMYRFSWGGKRKWMTFGTYPATSLASARGRADDARAALEAKPPKDPRTALAKPETFRTVCDEWVTREAGALRTGDDRKAALARLVYPALGERPIAEVRRSDIVRLLDRIEDERGPAMADKTLAIVRRVCNWHASRSDDFRSPIVRGMARTKSSDRTRARILTDDELRVVWAVAAGQGAFGRMARFLLLTGARRTEAAAMRWAELDGADWTLPAVRNKTKLDLVRPLPTAVLTVIGARPDGAVFVFSNDGGHTAVRGYGPLKAAFDLAVTAELRKHDPKAEPMPPFRLHDLRRTARSLMSRAGVPSDHAERCLGHVIGGVRGVYDRHEYHDEKARAYVALARLIDRIVAGRPTALTLVRVKREADAH
jgi:integrase